MKLMVNSRQVLMKTEQNRITLFNIGSLRFDLHHGVLGILSTILVSYALLLDTLFGTLPFWLSLSIIGSTSSLAMGSYSLLHQVPISTEIMWFIIPPHQEAFKRTISIIGYLNLRLAHQLEYLDFPTNILIRLINNDLAHKMSRLIFPMILLPYNLKHFLPLKCDLRNGNTWIFIIPMCTFVNIDLYLQFPSSWSNEADAWTRADHWNKYVANIPYLLLTLWCTLFIAFMFTVAFRGHLRMRYCYWTAAGIFGMLCVRLFMALLS